MNTIVLEKNQEFELLWEMWKYFPPSEPDPKTKMTFKVVKRNNQEMLKVTRKKIIFKDEFSSKDAVKNRFFAVKTGYFFDGKKVTSKDLKSMSVFRSVLKQYDRHLINNPILYNMLKFVINANKILNQK